MTNYMATHRIALAQLAAYTELVYCKERINNGIREQSKWMVDYHTLEDIMGTCATLDLTCKNSISCIVHIRTTTPLVAYNHETAIYHF
jgi:hypothetical protein